MTTLDQAVAQMRANGMPEFPGGLPRVNTPRIIRYGPKNKAWYRLHEFAGTNGRRYIAGAYGIWGALDPTKIEADWAGMGEADRARIEREQAALEQRERDKRERLAKAAAVRGRQQYRHALDLGPCPYLERKGVKLAKPLKVMDDGTLVVPAWKFGGDRPELVGVQKIAPDGSKRFNRGMAKAGGACLIGKPKPGGPVYLAEGVATALSVREALGNEAAIYVAFDAGNLEAVATVVRSLHPDAQLVVCADDDWMTVCDRHQREGLAEPLATSAQRPSWCLCNPGRTYAARAAAAVQPAVVVWPVFPYTEQRQRGHTDWNDLQALHGRELVAMQLGAVAARPVPDSRAAPGRAGGSKKKDFGGEASGGVLQAWTLIRGTDTLYDATVGRILKISHVRIDRGEAFVSWWLAHEQRRSVWAHDVVFEPAGAPLHQLNLFRGMERLPDATRPCQRLLGLLQYLCGEDGLDQAPLTDWVLKWLAYPLQKPGAKMRTAIVMHGMDEGTGKNLFFGAVREIYGSYASLVTQSELESDFNGWASQKLFMIANEVVSRMELRHQTGRLKNLITEDEIHINEKMLPLRVERNHMNFVFLSNETQPLILGPLDRRYCVAHTPPKRERGYYGAVRDELAAGGVEGLYAYLLSLDLAGFDEFAEAPATQAKRDLIELGMNSAQVFAAQWRDGLLDWPFVACRTQDAYRAYQRWCARCGERMPFSLTRFSGEIAHFLKVRKEIKRVPARTPGEMKQATVFLIGAPEGNAADAKWLAEQVLTFLDSLRAADEGAIA